MLKGKKLSILGDSISTYRGVTNDPNILVSLYDHPCFYRASFPLGRTYWGRLMESLGLELCVNNSWSGGNLSGRDNPSSGVNRASELSSNCGEKPDVIIVFMGINDLGRRVPLEVFAADYARTLNVICDRYPDAWVCCVNLPDRDPSMKAATERFNRAIDDAVARAGTRFFVADLFHSRLNNDGYYDNTVDGLHPDEDGMRMIAEVIEEAFRKNLA